MPDNDEKGGGLGSKFLGLFVERPGDDDAADDSKKTPAELVAELAAKSGGPTKPAGVPMPPVVPSNLKLDKMSAAASAPADFDVIFRDAGMDAAELDRVKKAEELLRGLPEATPYEIKRQIVEASLKAFGFEIEKIVLAAQNQHRALDAYLRVNATATAKSIADANIKSLHEKVAALKAEMEKKNTALLGLTQAADGRKSQVQKVLDFFKAPAAPLPPTP